MKGWCFRLSGAVYRHTDSRPIAAVLLDVLRQKCAYKAIPVPTLQTLLPHRPALDAMWSDMLSHQLPVLPPLNDFRDALHEVLELQSLFLTSAPSCNRAKLGVRNATRSKSLPSFHQILLLQQLEP